MPRLDTQVVSSKKGLLPETLFVYPALHLLENKQLPQHSPRTGDDLQAELADEKILVCISCSHAITSRENATEINGQHVYCFQNPVGIDFVIGCFAEADGCAATGPAEKRWSWFPPFSWSMALCRQCGNHLGWKYTADAEMSFFGLILNQLTEK